MINIKSLKVKIPILIIALVLITIIGTSYMSYTIFTEDIKGQIIKKNKVITVMISDQVSQYLEDAQDTVEYVSKSVVPDDMDSIRSSINRVYQNYKWMDLMFYMTRDGRITYSNPHSDVINKRNYVEREYYQHILKHKKTYISKVFISSILNKPHIIIASPLIDAITGELTGIIAGGVPLASIEEIVEKTQKSFDGRIYVVDRDGIILVGPDKENEGTVLNRTIQMDGSQMGIKELLQNKTQGVGEYTDEGETVYVSYSKIPSYGGMIIVEQNQSYITGQIGQIKDRFMSGIVFVVLIVFILSLYFAYTITNPIEKLVHFVRSLSTDLDKGTQEYKITTDDEIGELEIAFNSMSKELSLKMEELKNLHKREYEIKKYLNNILKSAASGMIVFDPENKISIFNTASEEITGYDSKFFINQDLSFLLKHIDFPRNTFESYINGQTNMVVEKECSIRNRDGRIIPLSISFSPVYNDDGSVISMVCMMKDLTKLKALEEQLRREDRLKTIGELSSSIIHELGNPLAGMTNLIEVLKDNFDEKDLREELLMALRDEVDMLNNLVINFLGYTRAHNNEPISTNILGVIHSALNILNLEILNKNIQVEKKFLPNVPLVKIDPSAVRQAFVNIFKNSIQALDHDGNLTIEVRPSDEGNYKTLHIIIKDNGVGISPDKIGQVFNPFFTTKVDGTGLGLSIVHKIIRENHGTVSVRSEVGKYTEFTICFQGEILDEIINY